MRRRLGTRRDPATRTRHLRTAKLAVSLIAIGFVGGPLSMAFLRGRDPFETAHAWIATLALGLFLATAQARTAAGARASRVRAICTHSSPRSRCWPPASAAMTGWVLLP